MNDTSPWVWVLVGVAATHVGWAFLFCAWWYWLTRGDQHRLEKAQRDFQTARRTIRDQRHTW